MLTLNEQVLWAGGERLLTEVPGQVRLVRGGDGVGFLEIAFHSPTAYADVVIGQLATSRFLALHRNEPFWMRPATGNDPKAIPVETQALFGELAGGKIALLVPLVSEAEGHDSAMRCSLRGDADGLHLIAETGAERVRQAKVVGLLVAVGERLEELTRRAAEVLAGYLRVPLRREKTLPAFIDDFGWCTWDAFYQEVSHEKVRVGLEALRALGVPPRMLILDDGWQSTEDFGETKGQRLVALPPNAKFHGDLTQTVRMAKEEFEVQHFLVWHALQGYWGGVAPERLSRYQPEERCRGYSEGVRHYWPEANTKWWGAAAGIIPPEAVEGFFRDYHALLRSQGVDGVKVDNQAAMEAFAELEGRARICREYQRALEASAGEHFRDGARSAAGFHPRPDVAGEGANLIHCMACSIDLLYTSKNPLMRTSTDFWPNKPETHGLHLWTNAAVATWFGHFVHPDWDMFHSRHPFAAFHAAARALSGGPIYVSDKPGVHDPDLLRKLMRADGRILRADGPATMTHDVVFADPTREAVPLKIWNTTNAGAVGVLGLFNCRFENDEVVRATASAVDIPPLAGQPEADYALHIQGAAGPLETRLVKAREQVSVSLATGEFRILMFVPIPAEGLRAAAVGLENRFLPAAAIDRQSRTEKSLSITIAEGVARADDRLAVWCEAPPVAVVMNGRPAPWSFHPPLASVELPAEGELICILSW